MANHLFNKSVYVLLSRRLICRRVRVCISISNLVATAVYQEATNRLIPLN